MSNRDTIPAGDRGFNVRIARPIDTIGPLPRDDGQGQLRQMLTEARARFGVSCFWNAPVNSDVDSEMKLVVSRLRAHGGRPGWDAAAKIEEAAARQVS